MGCGGSKNAVKNGNNPLEFVPKEIQDTKPDKIRKEITTLYAVYVANRDRLRPLLAEKYGINALIDEKREELIPVLTKKEEMFNRRQPLMERVWDRDAEDLHKAFQKFSTDKNVLVTILCARTYWQLRAISEVYERKFGQPLLAKVINDLTTMLGSLLTGASTGLSKLLTYRLMPQPERDAALLKDCTDGMTLDDAGLLEVLCTRTNIELKLALAQFSAAYKKDLTDVIKQRSSYKNYREFVLKILECNHDEENKRYDIDTARRLANELHAAGAARTLGFDPEPFIRILANVSRAQFESINDCYPNKQLIKDITAKLGGDFQLAVLTRCADKYEYFASRIEAALKGFSPDKETLCRILGCLSRPDCVKVKQAYARMGYKRTLEEAIRTVLKSQQTYQNACLMLISDDMTLTPLGSDKELEEEEHELQHEADRIAATEMVQYDASKIASRGEEIMASKRKRKLRLLPTLSKNASQSTPGGEDTAMVVAGQEREEEDSQGRDSMGSQGPTPEIQTDPIVAEEDRVLGCTWDGKGRFLDAPKLTAIFREMERANNDCMMMLDRLPDEIEALKGIYRTILRHKFETEAYLRIYATHIKALESFVANRERIMASSKSIKM